MMQIWKAENDEFDAVRTFYHAMIDAMESLPFRPKWQKDVYPSKADLKTAIEEQTLYVGELDGSIIAAMVLNQKCSEEYDRAPWPRTLARDEFAVIHMLGVHRAYAGQGYAKDLVRYGISLARENGLKAVRLDVLEGNKPAERLYERLGFQYIDTLQLYYEDTGRVAFRLYELGLV